MTARFVLGIIKLLTATQTFEFYQAIVSVQSKKLLYNIIIEQSCIHLP